MIRSASWRVSRRMPGIRSARAGLWIALALTSLVAEANEALLPTPALQRAERLTPEQLAKTIDSALRADWKLQEIEPAPVTSDGEFVRRAHLDLIGRIPSVGETRDFLDDQGIEKRTRLVETLLQRGAYANHFANTWRDLLLGNSSAESRAIAPSLEMWLRLRFGSNMPYDQIVRELLTSPAMADTATLATEPSTLPFYQASEYKPELLAATVSRVLLGVQLQCAQCHDHPFTHWKQTEFWSFAAFFTDVQPGASMARGDETPPRQQGIQIPEKDIFVETKFLDGRKLEGQADKRQALAKWIVDRDNPYFARAVVNRLWNHFFGRGFVHPVDDLDPTNAPSHPQLFATITDQFVLHDYDLKYLIRAIAATEAYQLSSQTIHPEKNAAALTHFARMPLRRMTGDQLYASFVQATGFREPRSRDQGPFQSSALVDFQAKFSDTSVTRTEVETSILQALSQMNGRYTAQVTDIASSETLTAVVGAPYLSTQGRIETLFVAALSRKPDPQELAELLPRLEKQDETERASAYSDLFWALLNSAEFVLNH